jgi:biotin synthase
MIRIPRKNNPAVKDLLPLLKVPLPELMCAADRIRAKYCGSRFDLCSIVNARSGRCSEDCRFCAQSSRYSTGAAEYPLIRKPELLACAKKARDNGAGRFGIVTSGRSLGRSGLARIADAVHEIRVKAGITVCASLGALPADELALLKKAGLSRYHHNIETSPSYFPRIVTTHSFGERVDTIKRAKAAGLEVCSGGIIGMGENWKDRIAMALLLNELDVNAVPVNILVPIKGTPLGSLSPLSPADAIRTICIFRIILEDRVIKVAAGRETVLRDFQSAAFMGGANGMLIGGYLTISGRAAGEDLKFAEEIRRAWNG